MSTQQSTSFRLIMAYRYLSSFKYSVRSPLQWTDIVGCFFFKQKRQSNKFKLLISPFPLIYLIVKRHEIYPSGAVYQIKMGYTNAKTSNPPVIPTRFNRLDCRQRISRVAPGTGRACVYTHTNTHTHTDIIIAGGDKTFRLQANSA